jgi:hypothetical protein
MRPLNLDSSSSTKKILKPRHVYSGILGNSLLQSCLVNNKRRLSDKNNVIDISDLECIKGKIICLEGNLKCGKSTAAQKLKKIINKTKEGNTGTSLECQVISPFTSFAAPLSDASSMKDLTFAQYVYHMSEALTSFTLATNLLSCGKIVVLEQSPFSVMVLSRVACLSGKLTLSEFYILYGMYNIWIKGMQVSFIVFRNVSMKYTDPFFSHHIVYSST